MSILTRTSVAIILLGAVASCAAEEYEELTLRQAGLKTDGASLLAYIKTQIPTPADQERFNAAIVRLGHRSYSVREQATQTLVSAGRPAIPLVRPAMNSRDLEVSRRAERIITDIEKQSSPGVMSMAVRVLAQRKPAGVVDVFLAYLPHVQDDQVEESVREALVVTGLERGSPHPAIRAALSDRQPRLRAASAFVLGRMPTPPVKELAPLLRDTQPEVRLLAAEAVLRGKDRVGVPVLLALLEEVPLPLSRRAEDILYHLAGESSPTATLGEDDAARKRCREAWQGWWMARGDKVDLTRFQVAGAPLGMTLHCIYDAQGGTGSVWLGGADNKPRWEIKDLAGPNDVQLLPGGRVLIAERSANRVTERDNTGRILWERRCEGGAIGAFRLPGGNTFITTWNSVLEVKPDGKAVWEHNHPGGFRHAMRGPTGRLLAITAGGQVLEFDRTGKVLKTITPERYGSGAGYWASVEQIGAGRFLVAFGSSRKVAEIDEAGKILWEADAANAVYATRLSNGHTLVSNFEEAVLIELDRAGKEVGRRKLNGRPFTVRKY